MEKRWILFFIVFTVAYIALIVPSLNRQAEDAALENGETADALVNGEVAVSDSSTTATLPSTALGDTSAPAPQVQENQPTADDQYIEFADAGVEIVNTGYSELIFSLRGGVPVSWKMLPSDKLASVDDIQTGEEIVYDLIPQVADMEGRKYPLSLEGRGIEGFNDLAWEITSRSETEEAILLEFTSPEFEGLRVVRSYTLHKNKYYADLKISVMNGAMRTRIGDVDLGWGLGWQGGFSQPERRNRLTGQISAVVAAGKDLRTKRVKQGDDTLAYRTDIGWVGQEKKYFATILVPRDGAQITDVEIFSNRRNMTAEFQREEAPDPMSVVAYHERVELQPGDTATLAYTIVAAPKSYPILKEINETLGVTSNYAQLEDLAYSQIFPLFRWVRGLSIMMLQLLVTLHDMIGNWGLAIIVLVLIIKTVLLYPSHIALRGQAKTMEEQKRMKPEIEKINEQFKNDPQKKGQEIMRTYREHGINPAAGVLRGCVPMLLQMPIFISLYVLLDQAIELRGQDFLWIHDLTAPDTLIPFGFTLPWGWYGFNILPLLMGVSQFFMSRLLSANITDPTQRQVMIMLPIFFTLILYNMPSGLMLYWVVQNIWQIGHTVLTKRHVHLHDSGKPGGATTATANA